MADKTTDIPAGNEVLRVLQRIEEHLAALRNGAHPAANRWLTIDEAAEELQLSQDTLERLIASGQLKAAELTTHAGRGFRRRYRVRRDWLDAYLLGTVRSKAQTRRGRRRATKNQPRIDFIE
jgi:excisionase family DNA binding protein